MLGLALSLFFLTQFDVPLAPPELRIEAPAGLAGARMRLESFDTNRLTDVMRLVGLRSPGPPIHVELATDSSEWAQAVPAWTAGFAIDGSDKIVIFPSRSPSYPDRSLDDVLRHEVAHVLISRASSGRSIPRWFNEGLAMSAEREWRFRDQTQLFYQLALRPRETLDTLDHLFQGAQPDVTRAYLLSGALVRQLLERYGKTACGSIVERVGRGDSFEAAFAEVTGRSTAVAEFEFWDSQHVWTTWIPIVFSQEVLWMAITVLALLAIQGHRRRNARIQKRWEEEDAENGT